jgi:mRNA interferase MazF
MKQGDIWETDLNPVRGSEQAGYRHVVIISGNVLNTHLKVVIVCPLTSKIKHYKGNLIVNPSAGNGLKKPSEVLTFHIRSVSKSRLIKKTGSLSKTEIDFIKKSLNEILKY